MNIKQTRDGFIDCRYYSNSGNNGKRHMLSRIYRININPEDIATVIVPHYKHQCKFFHKKYKSQQALWNHYRRSSTRFT